MEKINQWRQTKKTQNIKGKLLSNQIATRNTKEQKAGQVELARKLDPNFVCFSRHIALVCRALNKKLLPALSAVYSICDLTSGALLEYFTNCRRIRFRKVYVDKLSIPDRTARCRTSNHSTATKTDYTSKLWWYLPTHTLYLPFHFITAVSYLQKLCFLFFLLLNILSLLIYSVFMSIKR